MDFNDFLRDVAQAGIGIYASRLHKMGADFHIEVELDGLDDPKGGVTLQDCESFSQRLVQRLDREIEDPEGAWAKVLPEGLNPDNYSLEVSSAGAERELRLPEDLDRFRGQPLYLRYRADGKDREAVAVFEGREASDSGEQTPALVFRSYAPTARRARRAEAKKRRGGAKAGDAENETLRFSAEQLIAARLYLDF